MVGTGSKLLGALAASLLLVSPAARADEQGPTAAAQTDAAQPRFAVLLGAGEVYGRPGGSTEYFFLDGRMSAAVGVGYARVSDEDADGERPSTIAFAAAMRRYLRSGTRQPFLEASYSLLRIGWTESETGAVTDINRHYGPGLVVGYRHTTTTGFTVSGGAGGGWVVGVDRFEPIVHLGIGYTWRH